MRARGLRVRKVGRTMSLKVNERDKKKSWEDDELRETNVFQNEQRCIYVDLKRIAYLLQLTISKL
jgi:hypothetical protein